METPENTPAQTQTFPVPVLTKRQRYYRAHKDEAEFMKHNREQRLAYYYRNREQEKEKALQRYYAKKLGLNNAPAQSTPTGH